MARPKTGQTPPISFRPPKQLLKDFDATIEEGRSRSDVLIELMHDRIAKKRRERAAKADGDPDTMCGASHRTEHHGVARCSRGQGHTGVHAGHADDGTTCQWPARPVSSEETST
jgi:hypothetical protein